MKNSSAKRFASEPRPSQAAFGIVVFLLP